MILARADYSPQILAACGLNKTDFVSVTKMLEDCLNLFKCCYRRLEQREQVDTFNKGLLSDLDRKSIAPVALRYAEPDGARPIQMFFRNSSFNDEMMLDLYQELLIKIIGVEGAC